MIKQYYFPQYIFKKILEYILPNEYIIMKRQCKIFRVGIQDTLTYNNIDNTYEKHIKESDFIFFKTESILFYDAIAKINEKDHTNIALFKNIRFENNNIFKYIDCIDFILDGIRIDTVFAPVISVLQEYYEMNGIPFYSFKDGLINISTNDESIYKPPIDIKIHLKKNVDFSVLDNVKLLVDVYYPAKIIGFFNRGNISSEISKFIYKTQNQKEIISKSKRICVQLIFNSPTYFLISNLRLYNITINLNCVYKYNLEQLNNGLIKLTHKINLNNFENYSLNFSRIDNIILEFDVDEDDIGKELLLTAVNMNVYRNTKFLYGIMGGLRFYD